MTAIYLRNRFAALQQEVQQLYTQISGKKDPIAVGIAPIIHYVGADTEKHTIYIHPLLLITPSNLPKHLAIDGPNDSILNQPSYFSNLSAWLSKQFSLNTRYFDSLPSLFHQHIRFWDTPKTLDRIRRFALAHEVAHIHLNHRKNFWENKVGAVTFFAVGALALSSFHSLAFSLLYATGIAYVVLRISSALRKYFQQQAFEKEADLAAIKITKDYEGAKLFFEALHNTTVSSWHHLSAWQKLYRVITSPEELLDLSHPSPQTRLQYIRKEISKA